MCSWAELGSAIRAVCLRETDKALLSLARVGQQEFDSTFWCTYVLGTGSWLSGIPSVPGANAYLLFSWLFGRCACALNEACQYVNPSSINPHSPNHLFMLVCPKLNLTTGSQLWMGIDNEQQWMLDEYSASIPKLASLSLETDREITKAL